MLSVHPWSHVFVDFRIHRNSWAGCSNEVTIRLGKNISSLKAQRQLSEGTYALSKVFERLTSGLRINRSSDDAAGLSVSSKLNADARVFGQAIRNVNDGISVASLAESALNSLKEISQRQLELAEQAANGSYSRSQRRAMSNEVNKLVDEYNRITASTTFNGMKIFSSSQGTLQIQAGEGGNAVLSLDSSSYLARSIGDGTFQAAVTLNNVGVPSAVVSGDLNGDGNMDLIASNYGDSSVSILLGNGNGTFKTPSTYMSSGFSYYNLALGDVNGDGRLDLMGSDGNGGAINLFLGRGDGTFQGPTIIESGGTLVWGITVANDLNGDGKTDLIAALASNLGARVLLGNGDGTFSIGASLSSGGEQTKATRVGDFNGDGKDDVVITSYTGDSVSVLLGNGDGTFRSRVSYASGGSTSSDAVIHDFDGDGVLDMALSITPHAVGILLGNGDGTFKSARNYTTGEQPNSIRLGDLNGDGLEDLVTGDYSGSSMSVLVSNGDGSFKAAVTMPTATSGPFSITLTDLNNDGSLDIVSAEVTSNNLSLFFGNSLKSSTIGYLNISSKEGARSALDTIRGTLDRISNQLGALGSSGSRFEVALSNLNSSRQNYLEAASRITNTDVAADVAELVRRGILQKSAAAVLAQANLEPNLALSLLEGTSS